MKVRIWTLGPTDMGALAAAARIDQTTDLETTDSPFIEITLDNGATLVLEPMSQDTLRVTSTAMGRMYLAPNMGNQFSIIVPSGGPVEVKRPVIEATMERNRKQADRQAKRVHLEIMGATPEQLAEFDAQNQEDDDEA